MIWRKTKKISKKKDHKWEATNIVCSSNALLDGARLNLQRMWKDCFRNTAKVGPTCQWNNSRNFWWVLKLLIIQIMLIKFTSGSNNTRVELHESRGRWYFSMICKLICFQMISILLQNLRFDLIPPPHYEFFEFF